MKTYKQFLLEIERHPEEAIRMLGDLHRERVPENARPIESDQMLNLIPHAPERPVVKVDWNKLNSKHYPTEDIAIKDITSGQHTVSSTVVAQILNGQIKEHNPDHPVVIRHTKYNGDKSHIMVEGNHRTNGAILKGHEFIKCKVVDVGPETPMVPYSPRPAAAKNPVIPKSKSVSRFLKAIG